MLRYLRYLRYNFDIEGRISTSILNRQTLISYTIWTPRYGRCNFDIECKASISKTQGPSQWRLTHSRNACAVKGHILCDFRFSRGPWLGVSKGCSSSLMAWSIKWIILFGEIFIYQFSYWHSTLFVSRRRRDNPSSFSTKLPWWRRSSCTTTRLSPMRRRLHCRRMHRRRRAPAIHRICRHLWNLRLSGGRARAWPCIGGAVPLAPWARRRPPRGLPWE